MSLQGALVGAYPDVESPDPALLGRFCWAKVEVAFS